MSEEQMKCKCGDTGRLHAGVYNNYPGDYWITCDSCHRETESHETAQAAIDEWNYRPPEEDALRAELAAANAEIARLRGIIQNVENLTFNWRGEEYRNCCDTHPNEQHEPDCTFYQWEGDND